jgi:hypothetical protein
MVPKTAERVTPNPEGLQTLVGHSSITVSHDRHGHFFPGWDAEAGAALEAYVGKAVR